MLGSVLLSTFFLVFAFFILLFESIWIVGGNFSIDSDDYKMEDFWALPLFYFFESFELLKLIILGLEEFSLKRVKQSWSEIDLRFSIVDFFIERSFLFICWSSSFI